MDDCGNALDTSYTVFLHDDERLLNFLLCPRIWRWNVAKMWRCLHPNTRIVGD